MTRFVSALALVVGLLAAAPVVRADSHGTSEAEPIVLAETAPQPGPAPATGESGEGWHYETGYLFGVTRGLPEAGVRDGWCYPAMVLSVPFDLVTLPIAALAGLFG